MSTPHGSSHSTHPENVWRVSHAHIRALLVAVAGSLVALLGQRPDLVVLCAPFAVIVLWSAMTRPREVPDARMTLVASQLREGQWTPVVVRVQDVPHLELVASSLAPSPHVSTRPAHAARVHLIGDRDHRNGEARVVTRVRADRWGPRRIGPGLVGASSPWFAFRWGPVPVSSLQVRALPDPAIFDSSAPAPHPQGLVGQHRSRRPGDGSEFHTIRPFQWGDRLKRIHWPRTLRSGGLHVTSSFADQDTHVAVVVDAHYDLGASEGQERASSLDYSVRAAAAVAEHFLHQGDRVSLQVLSARTPVQVRPGTGRRHGHRILETLAMVQPQPQERIDPRRLRRSLGPGALVVMISALVSPEPLAQAAVLARSGIQVVVIDALVDDIEPPGERDEIARLAWRIRLLERDAEVRRVRASGVPVVPWRGPGSLDEVLRSMARHRRSTR